MRRFWLTIVLLVVALGGIGGYYGARAAEELPPFRLVTLEGDAELAEPIALNLVYGSRAESEFLRIDEAGSHYSTNQSVFDDLFRYNYRYPEVEALVEAHRGFMRGKLIGDYYTDEEWVLHAVIDYERVAKEQLDAYFELNWLKVDTGKSAGGRYRIEAMQGLRGYANVIGLQRRDQELHVLVQYSGSNASDEQHLGVLDYVVSTEDGGLLRTVPVYEATGMNANSSISAVGDNQVSHPDDYALLNVRIREEEPESPSVTVSGNRIAVEAAPTASQYYSYRYETGELVPITIEPDELVRSEAERTWQGLYYRDGVLTRLEQADGRIVLHRYDVTGQTEHSRTELQAEQFGDSMFYSPGLDGDRLYAVVSGDPYRSADGSFDREGIYVIVVDSTSGELLYKGEVQYDGPAEEAAGHLAGLYSFNLYVRP
ncbi:hypothetical protein IDH44_01640 [Paenibacillus sp. IB182496]|uniref:Uncharacterized protein n=1 Tax=Paenibacillus sabuli TaxID=2772509 RepID=A0A927BNP0_9BACL|nr:hypothetical protein [Paenibacillus sabuli]MBD2843881.1 hypothetical protein [Paenibacillus sabuli]